MTESQKAKVSYSVQEAVKVDGVDLPPGKYTGTRVRLGTPYQGQIRWEGWEYKIDTADWRNLDCTQEVHSGKIEVTAE